jgi:hypothetical protein
MAQVPIKGLSSINTHLMGSRDETKSSKKILKKAIREWELK